MSFVVEESGKENIVPVRLLSREARLYQRHFRDRERANFYTLATYSCDIDGNIASRTKMPCICLLVSMGNLASERTPVYSLGFTALLNEAV